MIDWKRLNTKDINNINTMQSIGVFQWSKKSNSTKYGSKKQTRYSYYGLELNTWEKPNGEYINATVEGSPHKYKNYDTHNADRFTLKDLHTFCVEMQRLGFNLDTMPIQFLEVGFMPVPEEYHNKDLILNTFTLRRTPTLSMKGNLYGIEVGDRRKIDRCFKMYCKDIVSNGYAPENSLRAEVAFTSSKQLKKIGITTLPDILKIDNAAKLCNILHTDLSKLLIFDFTINPENLTGKYLKWYHQFKDKNHWIELATNPKKERQFSRDRADLKELSKKHGIDIVENLLQTFEHEYSYVIGAKVEMLKTVRKSGTIYYKAQIPRKPQGNPKEIQLSTNTPKSKTVRNDDLVILGIPDMFIKPIFTPAEIRAFPEGEKRCIISGVKIGMQKGSSFMLHTKGSLWYQKHDKDTYKKLEEMFLTDVWKTSDDFIKAKEVAHTIRNTFSSSIKKEENKYPEDQTRLFDIGTPGKIKDRIPNKIHVTEAAKTTEVYT